MKFESPERKESHTPSEALNLGAFYPGGCSESGFLAPGENISVVIARDRATCERYEITPKQIGETIEEILLGKHADKFELSTTLFRGMQTCPFERTFTTNPFSNMDFTITNKKTGTSFNGPGLIVHLLKEHDFFEGDTPYRVDPKEAIEVLFEKN